jgi:hypothetical protein
MSVFDIIKLMEPLACISCGATVDDTVSSPEKSELDLGESKLQVLRLHDGRGGIKEFQTHDLGEFFEHYLYPGIVADIHIPEKLPEIKFENGILDKDALFPKKRKYVPDSGKTSIECCEICNKCRQFFTGELELSYEKDDDLFITGKMKIKPGRENVTEDTAFALHKKENKWFTIETMTDDNLMLTPKIESSTNLYKLLAEKTATDTELYLSSFESLDFGCKTEVRSFLKRAVDGIKNNTKHYRSEFANSVSEYCTEKDIFEFANSAFLTGLVFLYHSNKEEALKTLCFFSEENAKDFMAEMNMYDWYFNKDYVSNPLARIIGMKNGPNYFFNSLKEEGK